MCVCVLVSHYICPGISSTERTWSNHLIVCWCLFFISISIVLLEKGKKHHLLPVLNPPPPRAVAVCPFSLVVGSLLSAPETDGVRLMCVFVAFCQRRIWLREPSISERQPSNQQIPTWGGRARDRKSCISNCQANFTFGFEMLQKHKEMQRKLHFSQTQTNPYVEQFISNSQRGENHKDLIGSKLSLFISDC